MQHDDYIACLDAPAPLPALPPLPAGARWLAPVYIDDVRVVEPPDTRPAATPPADTDLLGDGVVYTGLLLDGYLTELAALDDAKPARQGAQFNDRQVFDIHMRMLDQVKMLADPATSFSERIDILRWIFTEPERDALPFSFARCVELASLSALSEYEYVGKLDLATLRDGIRRCAEPWLRGAFSIYPVWFRAEMVDNPEWVFKQISKDPQWLNKQLRARQNDAQPDLFN